MKETFNKGRVTGLSAYEIWLQQGNTGTEEEFLNSLKGGINPSDYTLPILALAGDITGMSKDNAVNLDYEFKDLKGTCSVKWQGSSSLAYPKKNFTVKFDNAFEAATGWGEQKKYCTKANFIDYTHARNVVSAKLWGQIVKSRNYSSNCFDMSKVTGIVTTWEGNVTVENGILTNGTSVSQTGHACFTGVSFPAGTYDIKFDVCSVTENEWGKLTFGFAKQEHGGEEYYYSHVELPSAFPDTPVNTWVSHSVENIELTQDAGFFLQAWYNPTSYRFRNIEIVNKNEKGALGVLQELPNGGSIDGFPVVITINGEFQGLYTLNIPKDGWMFGMGNGTNEAVVCADAHVPATQFKEEATLNGDFDLEYVTDENNADWVLTSLNRLINAVNNSDGTDLDTTIAQYLDWASAIDYYIFTVMIGGDDMVDKNYLLATYDGVKWFFSAYDMDSTYGMDWDGKKFFKPTESINLSAYSATHKLMQLIKQYKSKELKQRYKELRQQILNEYNINNLFYNFMAIIPRPILEEDAKKWPTIPSTNVNDVNNIINWYSARCKVVDAEIETLLDE